MQVWPRFLSFASPTGSQRQPYFRQLCRLISSHNRESLRIERPTCISGLLAFLSAVYQADTRWGWRTFSSSVVYAWHPALATSECATGWPSCCPSTSSCPLKCPACAWDCIIFGQARTFRLKNKIILTDLPATLRNTKRSRWFLYLRCSMVLSLSAPFTIASVKSWLRLLLIL